MDVTVRHQGAVIKTIGDAVMAAFPTPTEAVLAALEMRKAVESHVASWHLTDITSAPTYVRFRGQSGHYADVERRLTAFFYLDFAFGFFTPAICDRLAQAYGV